MNGIFGLIYFCWWIAGLVIFANKHNNCHLIASTQHMQLLVGWVLILESIAIGLAPLLLCCVCICGVAMLGKYAENIPSALHVKKEE